MKSIGCVRKIDSLGRVVIPMETRKLLGMENGDPLEFYIDGDHVILRKYTPGCTHCGKIGIATELGNIKLCATCRDILLSHNLEV